MVQRPGSANSRRRRAGQLAAAFALLLGLVGLGAGGRAAPPETSIWSDASPLSQPRTYAQALGLDNGNVLIEGGLDREAASVIRSSSELFDPRTGEMRLVETPGGGRLWQTLTALRDGRVLSVDGVSKAAPDWNAEAAAAMFDPLSARYVPVSQPTYPRSDHGATVMSDGRVLVAGGHDGPKFIRATEVYDPRTDRWSAAAPLPVGRSQFSMAALPNGKVLLAGGFLEPGQPTDTSILYDPATNRWTDGPRLSVERAIHTTVVLTGGDVLLIGGQRAAAGTSERYDWRRNAFVFAGTLVSPRMYGSAAIDEDGEIVLVGGFLRPESGDGFIPTALAERWDPRTSLWAEIPSTKVARAAAVVVAAAGGVWMFGGSAEGDHALDSVELLRLTYRP